MMTKGLCLTKVIPIVLLLNSTIIGLRLKNVYTSALVLRRYWRGCACQVSAQGSNREMIALRGKLDRDGEVWKWSGKWAFGNDLPPPAATAQDNKPPACLPFSYSFDRIMSPDEVPLPSAEENEDRASVGDMGDKKEEEDSKHPEQQGATASSHEFDTAADSTQADPAEVKKEAEREGKTPPEDGIKKQLEDAQAFDSGNAERKRHEIESKREPRLTVSTGAIVDTSKSETADPNQPESDQKVEGSKTEGNVTPTAVEGPKKPTFADKTSPDYPDFTDACTKHPDKCPPSGAWKGHFETATSRKGPKLKINESFCLFLNATPPADARTRFPDEATSESRNQSDLLSRIAGRNEIHARGSGHNQYGVFELTGSFNLESGILQCQRIYVQTTPDTSSKTKRSRSRRSSVVSGARPTRKRQLSWKRRAADEDHADIANNETQAQRRHSTSSQTGRPRKRLRVDIDATVASTLAAVKVGRSTPSPKLDTATTAAHVGLPTSAANRLLPTGVAGMQPTIGPSGATGARRRTATTGGVHRSTGTSGTLKLPAAGDPSKARWRAAHFLYYQRPELPPDTATAGPNNQQPKYVVYEGDMVDSKRHGRGICLYSKYVFLVLCMCVSENTPFVALNLHTIEFDSGMLYEGEWRRDKEHGKGTLMSSDRTRTIYRGDFEKGRIHGVGVYYYYSSQSLPNSSSARKTSSKKQTSVAVPPASSPTEGESRYQGEFKENLRHGQGTYYLPDGSIYSGSFRDNLFSGRGVFKCELVIVYHTEIGIVPLLLTVNSGCD